MAEGGVDIDLSGLSDGKRAFVHYAAKAKKEPILKAGGMKMTGDIKMKVTGGCHCGKITYEAELNLDNVVICHCTDCQSLSGSAFRTVAITESSAFKFFTGEPKIYVKTGDSGKKREQTFCSDCGSPIYSTSVGVGPKIFGIRLGTVDQRDQIVPKKQKWIGSSQAWTQEISLLPLTEKK